MKSNNIVTKLKDKIKNELISEINLVDFHIPLQSDIEYDVKDIIEDNVDPKYFLRDRTIEKIYREPNFHSKVLNYNENGLEGRKTSYCLDANYFKGTNTVLKSRRQLVYQNKKLRKLTPTECEKLMSWRTDWTKFALNDQDEVYEIANTQRYKMCGNGIVSNVPKIILNHLLKGQHVKVFSTFSGVDGSCQGLDKNFEIVGFSENDKFCKDVLRYRYPGIPNFDDITTIDTSLLPNFDLIFASAPCQAFSNAGRRLGLDDVRGTLFYEVARIMQDKQPSFLLFENVKGLLTHDGGNTFLTMLKVFSSLNYELDFELLNAKDFGVPHNRERIFLFAKLKK